MNSVYNAYIPKELARRLLDKKFSLFKYEVNGYDGKPSFFEINKYQPIWEESPRYRIPTYSDVLDMLFEKGFIISITPKEFIKHLEYQFEVYQYSEKEVKLSICVSSGDPNKSFTDILYDAINVILAFIN